MKEPDVYIGTVEETPWGTDPTPDDDEFRGTPQEVVQILGFDPADFDDE